MVTHQPAVIANHQQPLRVMSLHALLYCERLFYLEEVEEIRRADGNVFAGRRLHDDLAGNAEDETTEVKSFEVASEKWGLVGKVDGVRKRNGQWIVREHKRGRCRRGKNNEVLPWPSDRVQAVAYAVLLEEAIGQPVTQARIRYHANNVTAIIDIDDSDRRELQQAIARARQLQSTVQRPPVTENERLCPKCSLAPICLPEEERLIEIEPPADVKPPKLFPSNRERQTLHVVTPGSKVSRSSESLVLLCEGEKQKLPIEQIDTVLLHGNTQISTQAIQLCSHRQVAVQWMTAGGRFMAGTTASPGRVQQRIRQYAALVSDETCLSLARQLIHAKVETQLRYIMRATRGDDVARKSVGQSLDRMRTSLKQIPTAVSPDRLRGLEGAAAKEYFACLPVLLVNSVPDAMRPSGRSKHPPRDRFNCLLSYGYSLVQSLVHRSILAVGLEPALGFFHTPRTSAPPLMLDLMELFRTTLWEMPLVGSVNRGQWNTTDDFEIRTRGGNSTPFVWLSQQGRKKAISLFEQRLEESYKHPFTGQSLTYARIVELEVRLLEKEWTGCPGVFAQMRLR